MSVMSDLDYMVREEGARTAEDFEGFGIEPERAKLLEEVVETSIPGGRGGGRYMVTVERARLIYALEQRATREIIIVTDTPDLPDFYWEDER